jgi:hypothetical protein
VGAAPAPAGRRRAAATSSSSTTRTGSSFELRGKRSTRRWIAPPPARTSAEPSFQEPLDLIRVFVAEVDRRDDSPITAHIAIGAFGHDQPAWADHVLT